MWFSNSYCRLISSAFPANLLRGECHRTPDGMSKFIQVMAWCRQTTVVAWFIIDSDICRHMASPGHNELNIFVRVPTTFRRSCYTYISRGINSRIVAVAYITMFCGQQVLNIRHFLSYGYCSHCGIRFVIMRQSVVRWDRWTRNEQQKILDWNESNKFWFRSIVSQAITKYVYDRIFYCKRGKQLIQVLIIAS